jgi:hypothetical protein
LQLADSSVTKLFNLDGVDVWGGVSRAAAGRGGATDWELLQIRSNPQWWDSVQWFKDGASRESIRTMKRQLSGLVFKLGSTGLAMVRC